MMADLLRQEKITLVLKRERFRQFALLLSFYFIVILYAQVEADHTLVLLVYFDTGGN